MLHVQRIALERALTTLNALGATYRIIIGDESFGTLEVVTPKNRLRAPPIHPRGTLTNYFQPLMEGLRVGDVAVIDAQKFDIQSLRSAITAWSSKKWGNGSTVSTVTRETNVIEVLRVA